MEESHDRKATRRRIYMTEVTDVVSVWSEHTKLKERTKIPSALLSQWQSTPTHHRVQAKRYGRTDRKTQLGETTESLMETLQKQPVMSIGRNLTALVLSAAIHSAQGMVEQCM